MILVDGEPRSEVSAMDRGLAYGDGVFRTFPAYGGAPDHWQRQYGKLAHDAAALGLRVPEAGLVEAEVRIACRDQAACAVKIILTRGVGARGYGYTGDEKATRIVSSGPLPEHVPDNGRTGISVRLCSFRLAHQPALAGVKHLNRLENVLARAEWNDPRIVEGILRDIKGNVIGGTMTNLFIARAGTLATPHLDACGVAGVTRERIMEAAERRGYPCAITALSWKDVLMADEVFLVNSVIGVWPISNLDGQIRTPGEMGRAAQRWLEQDHDGKMA